MKHATSRGGLPEIIDSPCLDSLELPDNVETHTVVNNGHMGEVVPGEEMERLGFEWISEEGRWAPRPKVGKKA